MATFQFDFVGPERTVYSGPIEAVQLPGVEGEMTVLPGHAPVLTALKVGVIVINEVGHTGKRVLVRGGFADIGPTSVTVIAERANPFEEITQESLDRDIEAIEMLRDATEDFARKDELTGQIVQLRDAKVALNF
ncbi:MULTISPECIES: ATP synthase F1 subunit epsilon [unclassified Methylobacterium]|uniref:ATP synthase F1 subunit epsilon n=1 Tax=unclassified Methylobacterium TaxID=2615210 RepID=UPI000701EB84|nr:MULTISPECIES: ATP synthase F1 subunit epsilon [unclassified Methylobacterium]KQP88575.1 ATP synthase F0F1 subunit epsilon [Methylobacterium sp. Leaf117]KQP95086.1 ATP synthase F0F1 subunit epsilon [Methylobacterium sp. Leaf113]MCK2054376.1 ATP synthase F1 subunit epsilon [Methylobacterium sp. 37f]